VLKHCDNDITVLRSRNGEPVTSSINAGNPSLRPVEFITSSRVVIHTSP
jgi:hypothetical protein